jgi:diacylglycerol kinase (ATP)
MKNRSLFDSFNNALQGVIYALRHERNFRIHFFMALLALLAALFLDLDGREFLILTATIALVMVAELFNTSIEAVVDLVCGVKRQPLAKVAKDTAAGAVFIASLNAVAVGYVIIFRKLTEADLSRSTLRLISGMPVYLTLVCIIVVVMVTIIIKAISGSEYLVRGGMPSSHSALAFSTATCIFFLTENFAAVSMAYFLAFLVAQSRVEGKIHSILQVILGSLLGILITVAIFQAIQGGSVL